MSQHGSAKVSLGQEKLLSSRVGIGTWAIGGGWGPQDDEDSMKALHEALDLGCNLFDTAPLYGNGHTEKLLAQVLRERGKQATILTKVCPLEHQWAPAAGTPIESVFPTEHIIEQAEGSLRRLGIDCIDCLLLQTWCPSWDRELSWYHAMHYLRDQGKIRTWGISTSDHRHDEVNGVIEGGLVDIVEVPYSILDQRAAECLFPLALKYHISIIARSPLASEALTGLWGEQMQFPRGDWRRRVFQGEVLQRTVQRVNRVKALFGPDVPTGCATRERHDGVWIGPKGNGVRWHCVSSVFGERFEKRILGSLKHRRLASRGSGIGRTGGRIESKKEAVPVARTVGVPALHSLL